MVRASRLLYCGRRPARSETGGVGRPFYRIRPRLGPGCQPLAGTAGRDAPASGPPGSRNFSRAMSPIRRITWHRLNSSLHVLCFGAGGWTWPAKRCQSVLATSVLTAPQCFVCRDGNLGVSLLRNQMKRQAFSCVLGNQRLLTAEFNHRVGCVVGRIVLGGEIAVQYSFGTSDRRGCPRKVIPAATLITA